MKQLEKIITKTAVAIATIGTGLYIYYRWAGEQLKYEQRKEMEAERENEYRKVCG